MGLIEACLGSPAKGVAVGYQLGIDLGTTWTAAAVTANGRTTIVNLGARQAAVPSVVYLGADGAVLVGEAAERRSLTEPERVARQFKRRLGDPAPVLVGGAPHSAESLMAKVLRFVVDAVSAREGAAPDVVVVTHPANWGAYKKDLLEQAVRLAGLTDSDAVHVRLLTEPEAAAIHYAAAERVEPGDTVAVYDLGGGTFDAAILRSTGDGFAIGGAPEGIERLGGIDFDQAVFGHVSRSLGPALDELDPEDASATTAVAHLRDQCTAAKEALSTDTQTIIPVLLPRLHTEVRLTRAELEAMVRPPIDETIGALHRALRSAGVTPEQLRAVVLVGGSSRIPLVAQMITSALGRPVAVDTDPKHAVALGAARYAALAAGAAPAGPPSTSTSPGVAPAPVPSPPTPPPTRAASEASPPLAAPPPPQLTPPPSMTPPPSTPPPSTTPPPFVPSEPPRRRKRAPLVIGAIVLVALIGGGIALIASRSSGGSTSPNDTSSVDTTPDTGSPDTSSPDTTPDTTPNTDIFKATTDTASADSSPSDTAQSLTESSAAAATPDVSLDTKLLGPIDLSGPFPNLQATGQHVDPEIDFLCLNAPVIDLASANEGSVTMVDTGDNTKKVAIALFQFQADADAKNYVGAIDRFARALTTGNQCDLHQIPTSTADSVAMAHRTDPQGVVGSMEFRAVGQFVVFVAVVDPTGVSDDAARAVVDQQVQALVTGNTSAPPTT